MSLISHSVVDDLLQNHLLPRGPDSPLCVFDCDGTIIHGDIGEAMLFYQLEHFLFRESPGEIWTDHPQKARLDFLYQTMRESVSGRRAAPDPGFADMVLSWYFEQLSEMKTAKACADIVRLFAGYSSEEVRAIARQTLADELRSDPGSRSLGSHTLSRGIRFIAESIHLLRTVQDRGYDVWVVSGSNRWSVEAVCSSLGIPPDHIIGIDLLNTHGILTPQVKTPVPVLEGKVEILKERLACEPDVVISDSVYDVPLFQYSRGIKILVNSRVAPSSEFFSRGNVVRDNSWFVIERPTFL